MDKLKEYKEIIWIVIIGLVLIFYWYELRPARIRKECAENASSKAIEKGNDYWKNYYSACLKEKGLEK